jgi:hypothetical protein
MTLSTCLSIPFKPNPVTHVKALDTDLVGSGWIQFVPRPHMKTSKTMVARLLLVTLIAALIVAPTFAGS